MDCRSTGQAMYPAPGEWFIPKLISLSQVVPSLVLTCSAELWPKTPIYSWCDVVDDMQSVSCRFWSNVKRKCVRSLIWIPVRWSSVWECQMTLSMQWVQTLKSSAVRQKGLSTSRVHTQLDPFASKLRNVIHSTAKACTACCTMIHKLLKLKHIFRLDYLH